MDRKRKTKIPPTVHIELLVVPRAKRNEFREGSRLLYRSVRLHTSAKGGMGPLLFLMEGKPRPRRMPQNLRRQLGARPREDLWLELAFYKSTAAMRATLRELWKRPEVEVSARRVERLLRKRDRSWTIAVGELATG